MIPFDFAYYLPATIKEAVDAYSTLEQEGKNPMFLGGGSEIITLGRLGQLRTGAVIDLKQIPECRALQMEGECLVLGAGLTLNQIAEINPFPLLTQVGGRVADHTARCTISLGGNICSSFMYREGVLAFLVTDAEAICAGSQGLRIISMVELFRKHLRLKPDEFLVQLRVPAGALTLPQRGVKKTKGSRINYPLVSCAFLKQDGRLRVAVSGLCAFPFREESLEACLNDGCLGVEKRIDDCLNHLPGAVVDDAEGSAEYRLFVFKNTLKEAFNYFDEGE